MGNSKEDYFLFFFEDSAEVRLIEEPDWHGTRVVRNNQLENAETFAAHPQLSGMLDRPSDHHISSQPKSGNILKIGPILISKGPISHKIPSRSDSRSLKHLTTTRTNTLYVLNRGLEIDRHWPILITRRLLVKNSLPSSDYAIVLIL